MLVMDEERGQSRHGMPGAAALTIVAFQQEAEEVLR
jgi:hypothetical protein